MKLLYDGNVVGEITTNRSISLDECLGLLRVDIDEMIDENTPKWDYDLFAMDYSKK